MDDDNRNDQSWKDDSEMAKFDEYKNYRKSGAVSLPYELTEDKNIALCIVFSIITCGIYYIYWFYTISRRIQLLNNEEPHCAAEVALYFLIPFYNLYWMYTRARKMAEASANYWHYNRVSDDGIAYLLLTLFGFGIVAVAIIQNNFNIFARDMRNTL
jgi:hypothetical protein